MSWSARWAWQALGVTLVLAPVSHAQSALSHYDPAAAPLWRSDLPVALTEISGLTMGDGNALYAHGDEQATVYRLDLATRRIIARFGLAGRAGLLHADFEDIQVVGTRVFLVTSEGVIYEAGIGTDNRLVEAIRRTPGLSGGCEVEGMAWDPTTRALLLLCKAVKSKQWKDHVVVVAVSSESWRMEPAPRLLVSEAQLEAVTGAKRFQGSAIARHPRTGTWLLLAGPQSAYAEVDARGRVLGGGALDRARHPQPEGLAVAHDLSLLISDEGAKRAATITAYAYRQ
jgi:uncharacterized protein YjiK